MLSQIRRGGIYCISFSSTPTASKRAGSVVLVILTPIFGETLSDTSFTERTGDVIAERLKLF